MSIGTLVVGVVWLVTMFFTGVDVMRAIVGFVLAYVAGIVAWAGRVVPLMVRIVDLKS